MDAGPDDRVLPPCRDARPDQEGQLALEGENEQAQAFDSTGRARQVGSATRPRVPRAVWQVTRAETVPDHDNERADAAILEALQLHLMVLTPAHAARRHLSRPRAVLLLTDHALIEVSLGPTGLLGVEVPLDALCVEQMRLASAAT